MKRKRKILLLVAVVAALAVVAAGCQDKQTKTKALNESSEFQVDEQVKTGRNQTRLNSAQPAPQLNSSAERANLITRLKRINDPNAIGYIYLMSNDGKIVAFYTVKGKVSSVNSLLTNPEQVQCIDVRGEPNPCVVTSSPDLDGSYGTNGDAVFFFTTEGALVQWNGPYLWADQPLKITQQPVLIQDGQ